MGGASSKPPAAGPVSATRLYPTRLNTNGLRLLQVYPGRPDSPIVTRLSTHILDESRDCPAYDAISYVWGDEHPMTEIRCNDECLHVRINLWWALKRIRHKKNIVMLWADAICINQNDIEERNARWLSWKIYMQVPGRYTCALVIYLDI
jgi:hypothetical protein